jgi:hypothetical protein
MHDLAHCAFDFDPAGKQAHLSAICVTIRGRELQFGCAFHAGHFQEPKINGPKSGNYSQQDMAKKSWRSSLPGSSLLGANGNTTA